MKNIIINILKITIPLLLGVYVGWYFWDQFSESERNQFYGIFNRADYFILALSLLVGFLSHLARAKRWLYALKTNGIPTKPVEILSCHNGGIHYEYYFS